MRDSEKKGIDRLVFGLLFLFILPAPILALAGMDGFDLMFAAPIFAFIGAVLWVLVYLLFGVPIELYLRKPLTKSQGDTLFLATGLISLVPLLVLLSAEAKPGPRSSIELETQSKFAIRVRGHWAA